MLGKQNAPGSKLRVQRSGIASIEFALIAPILFLLIVGVFDAAKAVILQRQVRNTAHVVAITATDISVNPDKTTTLTDAEANQAMSLIYAEMPWLRAGIENGARSVTITSVAFKPIGNCTPAIGQNCFQPEVAFSVGYNGGGQSGPLWGAPPTRACGNITQITPTAPIPNGQRPQTVIRTGYVSTPDAVLLVDVRYTYSPLFLSFITGPITFWGSDMHSVRIANTNTQSVGYWQQYTKYSGSNGTGNCPNM